MEKDKFDLATKALIEHTYLALGKMPTSYSEYNDALWRSFGYGRQWERAAITKDEIANVAQQPQGAIPPEQTAPSAAPVTRKGSEKQ